MTYIAIFFLPVAYLLGYPLEWIINRIFTPLADHVMTKGYEWDAAYRD